MTASVNAADGSDCGAGSIAKSRVQHLRDDPKEIASTLVENKSLELSHSLDISQNKPAPFCINSQAPIQTSR